MQPRECKLHLRLNARDPDDPTPRRPLGYVLQQHRLADPREVITDEHARYYGIAVSQRTLLPGDHARIGNTYFKDWLGHATGQTPRHDSHPVAEGSHA
jgi:hypothetical protein